jgi:hypothetical protein
VQAKNSFGKTVEVKRSLKERLNSKCPQRFAIVQSIVLIETLD